MTFDHARSNNGYERMGATIAIGELTRSRRLRRIADLPRRDVAVRDR
jgi:hypothetical protein